MPRVVHFEITAEDPKRAVEFYSKVFGWKIEKWEGPFNYWLVTTGEEKDPGINGAITEKNSFTGTINTVEVDSVDSFLEKIKEAGGTIVMPKGPVPGQGYVAYAKDTEGNVFGVFKNDPSAK